jgi:transcriptional regulator with XRE-family HTH domain
MSTEQLGELVPEWTVGDRLRKARELRGLEQGPFAALIGVSRGTVSNYERGAVERYKPIVMNAWAAHTGVSVDWLESGATSPTPPEPGRPMSEKLARLTEAKKGRTRRSDTTRRYLDRVPALANAA